MNYIVQQIIYQIYTINIYCIFKIIYQFWILIHDKYSFTTIFHYSENLNLEHNN